MALFLNMRAVLLLLLIALFSNVNSLELKRRGTYIRGDGALHKPVIVAPPIGTGTPEVDWTYIQGSEPEAASEPGGAPTTNFGGVNVDEILEPGMGGNGARGDEAAAQQEIAVLERLIANSEKILQLLPEKKKRLEELKRKIGADEELEGAEGDAAKLEQLTKLLKELDIKISEQEEALVESKDTRTQLVEAIRKLKESLGEEVTEAGEEEKPDEGEDADKDADPGLEEDGGENAGVSEKEQEKEEQEDEEEAQDAFKEKIAKSRSRSHSKRSSHAHHPSADHSSRLKQRMQQRVQTQSHINRKHN
jgi:hypothetical protein